MISHNKKARPVCPCCQKPADKHGSRSNFLPYCSHACEMQHKQVVVECKGCKTKFTPHRFNQVYCTKKCGQYAGKEASKAKYEAQKNESAFYIYKRDNFQCVYCGASAHDGTTLHVDHVYPRAKGGGNEVFNLASCCSDCNVQKGDRPLSESKTIELWARNKQLDIEYGVITSYATMIVAFDKYFGKIK